MGKRIFGWVLVVFGIIIAIAGAMAYFGGATLSAVLKATRIWDRHDGFGMEYAQASLNKRKASVRADTGAYVQSFKRMFRASESRRSDLDYHSNN